MEENSKKSSRNVPGATEHEMSLSEKVCYYAILLLIKTLALLPFRALYILSDIVYYPFYYIVRYRRKIVRRNLTESFPTYSKERIVEIEKRFYHFFIDMAFESCKLISISEEEAAKRISFNNIDKVNDMLRNGRSISIFLGHYGNWEWVSLTGLWLYDGSVAAQIYHKLRNKAMDRIMRRLRERWGNKCVDMYKTVRFMAEASHDDRPYIIGFIADQSPKKREVKHFLRFLGQDIPVLTGTEKATKHYGYEAMYISMNRVERGRYECEFSLLHDDPRSLPDFELTALYFKRLEQEIIKNPEYYLWTHNRFKHARKVGENS